MTTDGNRTLTVQPNGTKVYTPFPDYEETVPASGGTTKRVTFSLAGQLIAVRVITATTDIYYYAYADHLGSIAAWSWTGGTLIPGSLARYEPYGGYRTVPGTNVNPGISDWGFTGHRMNNTNVNDLGLIYMNARYYLPEVGRFISPDSIVPDPQNPQSFNRYSYGYNNPVKYTDPSGHCAGSPDGIGNSQDENLCWAGVATIQNLWNHTDYWQQRWGSYDDFFANVGSHPLLGRDFFVDELMRYVQSDQYKAWSATLPVSSTKPPLDFGDYTSISATVIPTGLGFAGIKLIIDDYGNVYLNFHYSTMPEGSITRGDVYIGANTKPFDQITSIDGIPAAYREAQLQNALQGTSGNLSGAGYMLTGSIGISAGPQAHITSEGGLSLPGFALSVDIGRTFLIYDRGSSTPWYWQQ